MRAVADNTMVQTVIHLIAYLVAYYLYSFSRHQSILLSTLTHRDRYVVESALGIGNSAVDEPTEKELKDTVDILKYMMRRNVTNKFEVEEALCYMMMHGNVAHLAPIMKSLVAACIVGMTVPATIGIIPAVTSLNAQDHMTTSFISRATENTILVVPAWVDNSHSLDQRVQRVAFASGLTLPPIMAYTQDLYVEGSHTRRHDRVDLAAGLAMRTLEILSLTPEQLDQGSPTVARIRKRISEALRWVLPTPSDAFFKRVIQMEKDEVEIRYDNKEWIQFVIGCCVKIHPEVPPQFGVLWGTMKVESYNTDHNAPHAGFYAMGHTLPQWEKTPVRTYS